MKSFYEFVKLREGKESLEHPHVIQVETPMKLPEQVEKLAEAFKKGKEVSIGKQIAPEGGEKDVTLKNRKLYVTGEAVANFLLGRSSKNIELVTDAHPDEVEKLCKGHKPPFEVLKVDRKNGLTKVRVGGEDFEIHSLKGGTGDEDGPGYTSDLKQDALRKDFTLDCLYYEVGTKKITDPLGGINHLRDGIIKFTGNAKEKIAKDPSLMYRYAKWTSKLKNAKNDPEIEELIKSSGDAEIPSNKSRESVLSGLDDEHVDMSKYSDSLNKLGLLNIAFPGMKSADQGLFTRLTKKGRSLGLAGLLLGNHPGDVSKKLNHLGYGTKEINDAVFLLNLLRYKPEFATEFRNRMIHTSLTKRQIIDWAKANNLDVEEIRRMLDKEPESPKFDNLANIYQAPKKLEI